jgi:probable rRNA maturation factor
MIEVQVTNAHPRKRARSRAVATVVRSVLKSEKRSGASVSVVFIGSRRSRTLNRRYLGHDWVTDVISFPFAQDPVIDGEVYVNLDRARTQADQLGLSYGNEVLRLVVHGVLHLLGYDDRSPVRRRRMHRRQEALVQRLRRVYE